MIMLADILNVFCLAKLLLIGYIKTKPENSFFESEKSKTIDSHFRSKDFVNKIHNICVADYNFHSKILV